MVTSTRPARWIGATSTAAPPARASSRRSNASKPSSGQSPPDPIRIDHTHPRTTGSPSMHFFEYRAGELYAEDVPLAAIAAKVGTPTYVYSHATIQRHFQVFDAALGGRPHIICYSMKANSN